MDQLDKMIAWENGDLSEEDTCSLFQNLIDSGLCWRLQGCYGRMAQALIDNDLCHYRSVEDRTVSTLE
jgi:hypothetical protein